MTPTPAPAKAKAPPVPTTNEAFRAEPKAATFGSFFMPLAVARHVRDGREPWRSKGKGASRILPAPSLAQAREGAAADRAVVIRCSAATHRRRRHLGRPWSSCSPLKREGEKYFLVTLCGIKVDDAPILRSSLPPNIRPQGVLKGALIFVDNA
jgi:hypothetical protein